MKKIIALLSLLFTLWFIDTACAQDQWYHLSTTPNVVAIGPFQFTIKKITERKLTEKQQVATGIDVSKNKVVELEYEIKNTSKIKQEFKGVYRFPQLLSKETGSTKSFDPSSALSYGAFFMDNGFTPKDPTLRKEYDLVVASGKNLNDPYEAGQTKAVRYFMYVIPKEAKNYVFWISPTGCSRCAIQLKTGEAAGCEVKL